MYEAVTGHLGFMRSSDEYKMMALASYGMPRFLDEPRELIHTTGDGGFRVEPIDWAAYAKALRPGHDWGEEHADPAAGAQTRLEEVLLEPACGRRTCRRSLLEHPGASVPARAWPTAANGRVSDPDPVSAVVTRRDRRAPAGAARALGGAPRRR
ncbi:carbamoyltransferase N-terminal domain-containing protein [Streptosporangium sp. NPDC001559]|uniref:carbamoyltransferase N-terminal domain-containing protein n=1 Tax=Streptosporangium sp. NPDC001559 TaxID=3366187 RepID=UPI0036E82E8A